MMKPTHALADILIALVALSACTGPTTQPGSRSGQLSPPRAPRESRTLVMAFRYEPAELVPKAISATGRLENVIRVYNAALALLDASETVRPYLADALPQVNSQSWLIFPDGRMETTYRLRPGLTWHDGRPLTAEDFAFAYRVYTAPELGMFTSAPQDQIEELLAPDARTILVRWRALYPDAGALKARDLDPLPRHILEEPFTALGHDPAEARTAFINHPYWANEFIGLGPYRLERWEPGSEMEAVAFAGHALGRPRIDRLILRFIPEENTALTNILSENVHIATRNSIRFEQGMILKGHWAAANRGVVLFGAGSLVYTHVQFRPEYLKVPEALDVRVRKALAHAIDSAALNDGLFEGNGLMSDTFITRTARYYPELNRAIAKYPYDLRRTEQLMAEAGLAKGADGFYAGAAGMPIRIPFMTRAGTQTERHQAIMADTWRRAGFDIQPYFLPVTGAATEAEARGTFPGFYLNQGGAGEGALAYLTSAHIGSPATRWNGLNRGGWANAEYDRLWEAFTSTLDRSERDRQVIQMAVSMSETLPIFSHLFNADVTAHVAALRGPEVEAPGSLGYWNIHEWELD